MAKVRTNVCLSISALSGTLGVLRLQGGIGRSWGLGEKGDPGPKRKHGPPGPPGGTDPEAKREKREPKGVRALKDPWGEKTSTD